MTLTKLLKRPLVLIIAGIALMGFGIDSTIALGLASLFLITAGAIKMVERKDRP